MCPHALTRFRLAALCSTNGLVLKKKKKKQTKELILDCVKCSTEPSPLYRGDKDTEMMQHFKSMVSTSVITSLS